MFNETLRINYNIFDLLALTRDEVLCSLFSASRLADAALSTANFTDTDHCIIDFFSQGNQVGGWRSELSPEKISHLSQFAQENYELSELKNGNADNTLHAWNYSVFMDLLNTADQYGVCVNCDGFDRCHSCTNQEAAKAYFRAQCDYLTLALMHINGIELSEQRKEYILVDLKIKNSKLEISALKMNPT